MSAVTRSLTPKRSSRSISFGYAASLLAVVNAISIGSRTAASSANTRPPRNAKPAAISTAHSSEEAHVERADELAVGREHADALRRDRRGDRAEHADRREQHHVFGDLQHRVRELVDEAR